MAEMVTPPRFFPAETYYHIYNRGNRKEKIFLQATDYERFLTRLSSYKTELKIDLLAYCLMPNHFHLLLKQKNEHTLPKFMLRLCTSYAKYFNIRYETVGRLLQDRFKAKAIESERYLLYLSKYIHLNPAELLPSPSPLGAYKWSSYPDYLENISRVSDPTLVLSHFSKSNPQLNYKAFVESGLTEGEHFAIEDLILDTPTPGVGN